MINGKSKKIDFSQILDFVIILSFALFFITIIRNNSILTYVHPRIVPYIKGAVLFLLAICPFMLKDIVKKRVNKIDFMQYVIVGFTLLIAFSVPPAILNTANAGNKLSLNISSNAGNTSTQTAVSKPEANPTRSPAAVTQAPAPTVVPVGETDNSDSTVIDENLSQSDDEIPPAETQALLNIDSANLIEVSYDMFEDVAKYVGRQVQVYGFVYKDEKMKKDEFVIGRYAMACCAADLSLVGFLNQYEESSKIKKDGWYSVKGIIEEGSYDGEIVPRIKIHEIHAIKKPEDEYVYP